MPTRQTRPTHPIRQNAATAPPPPPGKRDTSLDVLSELSACLALVRPVGMGDDAAAEWLAVAAAQLADLSPDAIQLGCKRARAQCTHHAQIVPAICDGGLARFQRDMAKISRPFLVDHCPPKKASTPKNNQISDTHRAISQAAAHLAHKDFGG